MPKNQNKPKAKKYRRDLNHAEPLDNIDFFGIILKNPIILVYDPPADWRGCPEGAGVAIFLYTLFRLHKVNTPHPVSEI